MCDLEILARFMTLTVSRCRILASRAFGKRILLRWEAAPSVTTITSTLTPRRRNCDMAAKHPIASSSGWGARTTTDFNFDSALESMV